MPRYSYEPSSMEYYDLVLRRVRTRDNRGYRVKDKVFGQIAQCKRSDDAERIVEALNFFAEHKK